MSNQIECGVHGYQNVVCARCEAWEASKVELRTALDAAEALAGYCWDTSGPDGTFCTVCYALAWDGHGTVEGGEPCPHGTFREALHALRALSPRDAPTGNGLDYLKHPCDLPHPHCEGGHTYGDDCGNPECYHCIDSPRDAPTACETCEAETPGDNGWCLACHRKVCGVCPACTEVNQPDTEVK